MNQIGAHFWHKFGTIGTIFLNLALFLALLTPILEKSGTIDLHFSVNLNQEQERQCQ